MVEQLPRVKLAAAGRIAGGKKEEGLTDKAKSCVGRVGAIARKIPWSNGGMTCRSLLTVLYG